MRNVKTVSFCIPTEQAEMLKAYANNAGVSTSKVLSTILKVYFGGNN